MSEPTQTGPVHAEVDPDALRRATDALAWQGVMVQGAIDLIVSAGGRGIGGEWAPPVIVTARAPNTRTASPAGISRPGNQRGRF
jgi:hypothetical protein